MENKAIDKNKVRKCIENTSDGVLVNDVSIINEKVNISITKKDEERLSYEDIQNLCMKGFFIVGASSVTESECYIQADNNDLNEKFFSEAEDILFNKEWDEYIEKIDCVNNYFDIYIDNDKVCDEMLAEIQSNGFRVVNIYCNENLEEGKIKFRVKES